MIHSSKSTSQGKDHSGDNTIKNAHFLETFGVNDQQFQTIFSNLTQSGVALYKIVYGKKNVPSDLIVLDVNSSFEKIFGVKKEKILLKKVSAFYAKFQVFPVDWKGMHGRVAVTGKPEWCDACFQPHDKWYQVYAYSPKKGYIISLFMDITQRKKAEQQFIISGKWLRRLYETTHDGIMARDIEARVIDCNQAYAKMLGYTKKELKSLSVQQLLPMKWYEQREKIVNKVLQTGRSIVFEREYKRKDGSIFPASVRTWRLTDGKGKPIGIWSIVRDISEQKAHQKNLEAQTAALEKIIDERTNQLKKSERLAAIGQTAGMVGHDLRNPLQSVTGELYLAKCEVQSLPESEPKRNLQESIQIIEEQAVYMDKIVSDLQAFVQPLKIDKKPVNLKELVDAVLSSVIMPANIALQVQIDDDFPQVNADLQLLKRVLINLVTNAVQAMPDGGKLNLKSQITSDGQISVSVEDTGVGIPEKIKPQIFTPLFTTKPRGQGFGLAVCKRAIEAHGGAIGFESQEGNGAKFTIRFPAN